MNGCGVPRPPLQPPPPATSTETVTLAMFFHTSPEKSCKRETLYLLTYADSSTNLYIIYFFYLSGSRCRCQVWHAMCHVSHVTCHMSLVMGWVSPVIWNMSLKKPSRKKICSYLDIFKTALNPPPFSVILVTYEALFWSQKSADKKFSYAQSIHRIVVHITVQRLYSWKYAVQPLDSWTYTDQSRDSWTFTLLPLDS